MNVRIDFSREADAVLNYLKERALSGKSERILFGAITYKLEIIKQNPFYGQPIAKKLIPLEYKKQGITSLYRLELPQFWRMLYTVKNNKVEILAFVLDIVDHKDYNKKFGYK
jgi:Txe/YoeB family toxin of Txe-Axe toxin-antitoxin module